MKQEKKYKAKILIVEDDEDTRDIYCKALSMNEFETISAVNGKDGLEKSIKEVPDLILLDILMPIMDGFAMLKKLREEKEPAKNIPVIMLTNLSADSDDIITKAVDTGLVYYLVKASISVTQLVSKVKESLNLK